jgi:single-strand DNA-binding protein
MEEDTMSGEIPFTAAGNLTRDPEVRWTAEGKPVAGLAIAVTPRRYDPASGQWVDGSPTYVDLTVWGEQAEHVADSLRKGDRVIATGRWTTRTYTVGGEERRKLEVVVDEIGPSLRWAVALPTKATAKPAGPGADEPPV